MRFEGPAEIIQGGGVNTLPFKDDVLDGSCKGDAQIVQEGA